MSNCIGIDNKINENIFTAEICKHDIYFDEDEARESNLKAHEIRERWPRLYGRCPLGCGFNGIAYASMAHYLYGDW